MIIDMSLAMLIAAYVEPEVVTILLRKMEDLHVKVIITFFTHHFAHPF